MGKLRVLSGSEVCRILEQNGFVGVRQRGSHQIMQRRFETTTITVPVPLTILCVAARWRVSFGSRVSRDLYLRPTIKRIVSDAVRPLHKQ